MALALVVGLAAAAAGCGSSSSTLGHAAWVKAMDGACTRADTRIRHAANISAITRAGELEGRALLNMRPSAAADVQAQQELVGQIRVAGKVGRLPHPTASDQQHRLDAEAAFMYEARAAGLAPCAAGALLAVRAGPGTTDGAAAVLDDGWLCDRGNALSDRQQQQVTLATRRFIGEEAAAQTPIHFRSDQGPRIALSRWLLLADDYDVLTGKCRATFTRLSLEGAMRAVLDQQPEPVPLGNAAAAAFVRYLNQVRQANVDFFSTDQLLRADGPHVPVPTKKQFAALQQRLTADVREVERVTPPPGMQAGHAALVKTMSLARVFERNDSTATLGESDWIGNGLVRAEKLRNVWLTAVYRLVRRYRVLTPSWAGATPAQLNPS